MMIRTYYIGLLLHVYLCCLIFVCLELSQYGEAC